MNQLVLTSLSLQYLVGRKSDNYGATFSRNELQDGLMPVRSANRIRMMQVSFICSSLEAKLMYYLH